MRKIFIQFLVLGVAGLLMLAACKKDETNKVTTSTGTASALTASTTAPVLSKATLANTAVTFSGTNPNYGYSAAVTNTLQLAVKGTNFAAPVEVSIPVGAISKAYTVQDFNNLLISLKLPFNVAAQVDVRVKSQLSTTAGLVYSNVVTVTATPFPLVAYLYVPGAYQGWDPASADSLKSETGNGIYKGIINFTPGNVKFKLTPGKKWDGAFGDGGAGKISTTGGDITAPGDGRYYIIADVNANTIVFGKADYFALIGSATPGDWSTDTDMKFNNGTQMWESTVALKVGEVKVRMNHAWDNSYGIPKASSDGFGVAGTLNNYSNDNIAVAAAGNYKATFNIAYSTAPDKIGKYDNSVKTATYTLTKQ